MFFFFFFFFCYHFFFNCISPKVVKRPYVLLYWSESDPVSTMFEGEGSATDIRHNTVLYMYYM